MQAWTKTRREATRRKSDWIRPLTPEVGKDHAGETGRTAVQ